jgi:hypothetical protein
MAENFLYTLYIDFRAMSCGRPSFISLHGQASIGKPRAYRAESGRDPGPRPDDGDSIPHMCVDANSWVYWRSAAKLVHLRFKKSIIRTWLIRSFTEFLKANVHSQPSACQPDDRRYGGSTSRCAKGKSSGVTGCRIAESRDDTARNDHEEAAP